MDWTNEKAVDQNGNEWEHGQAWKALIDYKGDMNTAMALQIAMDVMQTRPHPWTVEQVAAARGALSGVRAQRGVVSADSDAFGHGEEGWEATHEIDVWVYG